jgi:lipopolysaccharide export system protein LptC
MAAADMPMPRRPLPPQLLRHARLVAAMRLVLPGLAAVLLALLALWSKFGLEGSRLLLSLNALGPHRIDSLTMSNPHFDGIDEKKRPFSVSADQATQLDQSTQLIGLTAPQADITLENGAWVTLTAADGRYQRQLRLLDLLGAVNLFHDQGYELHTRDMQVDLANGRATGHQPVQGQGPAGELTGDGLELSNGGKRILLTGHAHLHLYSDQKLDGVVTKP